MSSRTPSREQCILTALGNRHIATSRAPIPDVPVVYLLEPNAQNLQNITNDLQKGLYSPAYINFLSSIPRPLLEDFATMTATAGTSEQIANVFDQYLNFIVAEPDLFSLGMEKDHVYWALNSAKTQDEELDHVVDKIVSGLFSVVVTMGVIPIIRASRGAAAEMIAQKYVTLMFPTTKRTLGVGFEPPTHSQSWFLYWRSSPTTNLYR